MLSFKDLRSPLFVAAVLIAIAITGYPKASGEERPEATLVETVELKAPKKLKKKRMEQSDSVKMAHAPIRKNWTLKPVMKPVPEKTDKKGAPVSRIKTVLAVARSLIGTPYRYGAVGPSSFDCSGFTAYVWKKAGVHLPHNSSAQHSVTRTVAVSDAQPGDLVFSPGHVGLYIGDGKMIHSPQSGDHVRIAPIHPSAYAAGRVA